MEEFSNINNRHQTTNSWRSEKYYKQQSTHRQIIFKLQKIKDKGEKMLKTREGEQNFKKTNQDETYIKLLVRNYAIKKEEWNI